MTQKNTPQTSSVQTESNLTNIKKNGDGCEWGQTASWVGVTVSRCELVVVETLRALISLSTADGCSLAPSLPPTHTHTSCCCRCGEKARREWDKRGGREAVRVKGGANKRSRSEGAAGWLRAMCKQCIRVFVSVCLDDPATSTWQMFVFFLFARFSVCKYQSRTTPPGCVCLCVRGREGGGLL